MQHPSTPRCRASSTHSYERLREVVDLGDRVMRPAPRAEPVGTRLEVRLEDRFQHQLQGRLDHPVGRGRDAQPAQLAAGLGDHPFPYRHRVEAAGLSAASAAGRGRPRPLHGLDVAGGLAVHPSRARPGVAPHPIPRHKQKRGIGHQVEQIVEPPMRMLSCPTVQFGLDPQYPVPRPDAVRSARSSPATSWHSSSSLPACWPPSPCARLSPARTTTGPPSHPPAVGWQRAVPTGRAGCPIRSATAGMVPTFTSRSIGQGGARLYPGSLATPTPQTFGVASPPAAKHRLRSRPESTKDTSRALHAGPHPPGSSRHYPYGASTTGSLTLHLLASRWSCWPRPAGTRCR